MSAIRRAIIVSNGYGEDLIGARVGAALHAESPDWEIRPIPLIGDGRAYLALGMSPAASFPVPKSGGFLRTITDLMADLRQGLIGNLLRQRRVIQTETDAATLVIAVGDVFCLLWATAGKKRKTVFLPTAKSDLFMPHSAIERWLIRRRATWVVPRDAKTATTLRLAGIPADYVGNPMMDGLISAPLPSPPDRLPLAVLPGSREEAYGNLDKILNALNAWPTESPPLWVWICVSPNLEPARLEAQLSTQAIRLSDGNWQHKNGTLMALTTDFPGAVIASRAVIGLAGTANEQAVWLGKPVVAFVGTGPQSSRQRFLEQTQLLGHRLLFCPTELPESICDTVLTAISLPVIAPPSPSHSAAIIAKGISDIL